LLEFTQIYDRSLGEDSDVVSKEMYTFLDKSGQSVSLRPENTAGVVRAFLNRGDHAAVPFKVFYAGPMFRYERPQRGRYRQFHQIGVEALGSSSPTDDVEVIQMASEFLWQKLQLGNDTVKLNINTLGDLESRARYKESLRNYFSSKKELLSSDSAARCSFAFLS